MMNKKSLLLILLSIAQSNFCMDVAPVPGPKLAPENEWTLIPWGGWKQGAPFIEKIVAWKSDSHILEKGLMLEGQSLGYMTGPCGRSGHLLLKRGGLDAWEALILSTVSEIKVRLLTLEEARCWVGYHRILTVSIDNLLPNAQSNYLRECARKKFPGAICLLALKKKKENLVAQCCDNGVVQRLARLAFAAQMHDVKVKNEPLVFD